MPATLAARAGGLIALRPAGAVRAKVQHVQPRSSRSAARRVAVRAEEEAVTQLGQACSIDDMGSCSVADLEEMYVNALWSFYESGDNFTITDEQYDQLKTELSWQGSGFPTLRADEVKFVKASIEKIRGNEIMTEEEYGRLTKRMQLRFGRRADVTALLLYTKGQQMLEPEEYETLKEDMAKLGLDIGLKGAACTLSNTPDTLSTDFESLATMFGGLAALPFAGASALWILANILLPVDLPFSSYFLFTGGLTAGLVYTIMNVAELTSPTIVVGQCPCCETPVNAFFSGADTAQKADRACQVCGTKVELDRSTMKLSLTSGPKFVDE